MLNTPNLDDQRFEEIVEEAVRSIPYVYPEWTDHNASDPGKSSADASFIRWLSWQSLRRSIR